MKASHKTAPEIPESVPTHEATLTGEDVVPGFACPVGQLFA